MEGAGVVSRCVCASTEVSTPCTSFTSFSTSAQRLTQGAQLRPALLSTSTQFTSFTSTKVQRLTQRALRRPALLSTIVEVAVSPQLTSTVHFTCFTGTQVQILTQKALPGTHNGAFFNSCHSHALWYFFLSALCPACPECHILPHTHSALASVLRSCYCHAFRYASIRHTSAYGLGAFYVHGRVGRRHATMRASVFERASTHLHIIYIYMCVSVCSFVYACIYLYLYIYIHIRTYI